MFNEEHISNSVCDVPAKYFDSGDLYTERPDWSKNSKKNVLVSINENWKLRTEFDGFGNILRKLDEIISFKPVEFWEKVWLITLLNGYETTELVFRLMNNESLLYDILEISDTANVVEPKVVFMVMVWAYNEPCKK